MKSKKLQVHTVGNKQLRFMLSPPNKFENIQQKALGKRKKELCMMVFSEIRKSQMILSTTKVC